MYNNATVRELKILKFGWTSVWNLENIRKIAKIIEKAKQNNDVIVVVSAMSQVTNTLSDLCVLAQEWKLKNVIEILKQLKQKHNYVIEKLCNNLCNVDYLNEIELKFEKLNDILKWVSLLMEVTDKTRAKVLYFWEILSSILVSLAINQLWIESKSYLSRDIIVCYWNHFNSDYDKNKSRIKIKSFIEKVDISKEVPVITGFWWWNAKKEVYLFDRWWSDYVATVLWKLFEASVVEIWTDVDWFYSADPRIVDKPVLWKELDYAVASEFALVWTKVLHSKTISPIWESKIPLYIKNTFNPDANWTRICALNDKWVKWISIDDKQVILSFVDLTMFWNIGYISSVTDILCKFWISIDSLATTEASFSISIRKKYYSNELLDELKKIKKNFYVNVIMDISKISIVWDRIDDYKILSEINDIIMISSGSFWKSLTIFVKAWDSNELLKKLHKKLFEENI